MIWDAFTTYNLGYRSAFEALNNQLFERYIRRTYSSRLKKFRVVNGAGGDGGVEAYAELDNGAMIAVQSKWFKQALQEGELGQIRNSIVTAIKVRPQIKEYIICIPHDRSSQKIGRGKKVTANHEEKRINDLVDEIYQLHPDLTLTWWFDNELRSQLQHSDNEGILKYWFEKEVISLAYLKQQFQLQKQNNWLKERYIPQLHAAGVIDQQYQQMVLSKTYRDELSQRLEEKINKLNHTCQLLSDFIATQIYPAPLGASLEEAQLNLECFKLELVQLQAAVAKGNELHKAVPLAEVSLWPLTHELEKITPTHRQKAIIPKLVQALRDVHTYHLPSYLTDFEKHLRQTVTLIRGRAGTGKTHGLANTVEKHLNQHLPALIIQASSTPCANWTEILSHVLELPGWNKHEIFAALESIAVSRDVSKATALKAGEEVQDAPSTVLICVDGLEENSKTQTAWCSRISETIVFAEHYPRIRFLFSARDYYKRHCIDAYNPIWQEIDLPAEGDISIWEVAEEYLHTYNIRLNNLPLIKGLDSLLALRLFCEQYKNEEITSASKIVTATRDLLRLKVDRVNQEFLSTLANKKGLTQQPVHEALLLLAEFYYQETEIEHNRLHNAIQKKIGTSFYASEVDILLDFLVQHGILVRLSKEDEADVLPLTKNFYRVTYQSITEHILSEKIYQDIKAGRLGYIPDILHTGIVMPLDGSRRPDVWDTPPNEQIIQSIVNRLFAETGKLIGEDDFLAEGFNEDAIVRMQYEAMVSAPRERAMPYKQHVDELFFAGGHAQYTVLKYLIVPSSRRAGSVFGAEYLHDLLMSQPTAFERDKLWSGLDPHEKYVRKEDLYDNNLNEALTEYGTVTLTGFEEYNESPLLLAWGLSTLDQALRDALRKALSRWAIKRPEEFLKLLDKLFHCNDPQIQEDLSSVALAVASYIDDPFQLRPLAHWALTIIFSKKVVHRNVIVRQGFRAVVEKAFHRGAVTCEQVELARPAPLSDIQLVALDFSTAPDHEGDHYPIVHDLAWYVIKYAYDHFLEHPTQMGNGLRDNDCPEARDLLNQYRTKYSNPGLYAHGWAVAAANGYIRATLGLTRTDGNTWTQATHGSKSKMFTYEEKYTWLAVHFLQGYLSDYIPMEDDDRRSWVTDYSKITDIPNPGEEAAVERYAESLTSTTDYWIIKENLAPTVDLNGNINEGIKSWVHQEPVLHFACWLHFEGSDFPERGAHKRWLALYNYTALEDASRAGFTHLHAVALLVRTDDFAKLKERVESRDDGRLYFTNYLDGLAAYPDTSTYANPGDVVWMDWIKERGNFETIHDNGEETKLHVTIAKITQGTVEGEKYYRIPSKLVRNETGIQSFFKPVFLDSTNQTVSFLHQKSDGLYRDNQEIVLVDEAIFARAFKGWKLCWFVEYLKQKNPLNETLKAYDHDQKVRKYFVWQEGDQWQAIKFWEEYFSNQRDATRAKKKTKVFKK